MVGEGWGYGCHKTIYCGMNQGYQGWKARSARRVSRHWVCTWRRSCTSMTISYSVWSSRSPKSLLNPSKSSNTLPLCLVDVLGSIQHFLYLCLLPADVEQRLADQLCHVPLALHHLPMIFPHLSAQLQYGIGGCGGELESGYIKGMTMRASKAPVACWSPCPSSLSDPPLPAGAGGPCMSTPVFWVATLTSQERLWRRTTSWATKCGAAPATLPGKIKLWVLTQMTHCN